MDIKIRKMLPREYPMLAESLYLVVFWSEPF